MIKTSDYNKTFERLAAVQKGHFILTSGNHSDTYVQCARILENPKVTAKLAKELIKPWNDQGIDIVVGPALGGIILSYELARPLNARAMYLERVEGKLALRRGFTVPAGSKVIVAEDVITTGGSVKEVIDVVIKQIAKIGVRITDKPKITVQNIVASGSINLNLNLNLLALQLENTEYEPEQFPGLVYKLNEPTATFLLFSNGKLVCTGTKNKEQLDESMVKLNKNIRAAVKKI